MDGGLRRREALNEPHRQPGNVTNRRRSILVEGFGPDSVACATFFLASGNEVTIAAIEAAPRAVRALAALGAQVLAGCDLDASELTRDVFVVDCWTSELAPRVVRHRQAGARLTSIGDLVLANSRGPVLGVTGSGGKTTATRLASMAMRAGGLRVVESRGARAGNAWPSADVLGVGAADDWLAVELTSTHLAFMRETPAIAVITSFWPDHVELHGSVGAYRQAKGRILGNEDQHVVINADDEGAADFADLASGPVVMASAARPVAEGVGVVDRQIVLRRDHRVTNLGPRDGLPYEGPLASVAVTALCAAIWAGADPNLAARALRTPVDLPYRRRLLGVVNGVSMIDDSAATTPRKALAVLAGRDLSQVIMIVGGERSLGGAPVMDSVDEQAELDAALAVLGSCRAVVAFGPAAVRVTIKCARVESLADACAEARRRARRGDSIIVAPMFPVDFASRDRLPALLGAATRDA